MSTISYTCPNRITLSDIKIETWNDCENREMVWVEELMVVELIHNCIPCQSVTKVKSHPSKVNHYRKTESSYWFTGSISKWFMYIIFVSQRLKYPGLDFTSSTSCNELISILKGIFSIHGIPEIIASDNGPPFLSHKLVSYSRQKSITYHRIIPLWPCAIGQVERFMCNLKKVAQTEIIEKIDWRTEIYWFLAT